MMREKWTEYYSEYQLKALQSIEVDLFKQVISICSNHSLQYFVYGGTLLGVEKYQGMIPWDDDIDIAMPRESYTKFISCADKYLPDDVLIQTPENCPSSPYPYIKIRKKGTKYVEYINRNLDIETGIYIDIYPVDRIPDDEKLRQKQFQKVRKWILIYVIRQSRLYDKKEIDISGKLKNVFKWCLSHILKVFSQKYCYSKITHYMTMYNNQKTQRYAALNSPNYNNIYNKLFPLQEGRFGDMIVNIPGDHKTHLYLRYGEYSKDLPEELRFGHIPYILDLGEYKLRGQD